MKTISLSQLRKFLDSTLYFSKNLNVEEIDSSMTNGLMVKGREEISKIGFGVSASLRLFQKAEREKCDAIIVHHSFNLPSCNRYDSLFQKRIVFLIKSDISLFGYHFLLDAHPKIGNNIQILKMIGAVPTKSYLHNGVPWGWMGEFDRMVEFKMIKDKLKACLSKRTRTVIYPFGPKKIKKVVAISGKGAPASSQMQSLIDNKIDLFITGEVHEYNRELFYEAGVNFIAGGHYSTEVFGIKALMRKLAEKLPNLKLTWLELFNEV